MGRLEERHARLAFANFDAWATRACEYIDTTPADMRRAEGIMRRLDLTLRTPDAIHVAIALRVGATLGTLDAKMASDARHLGVEVVGS